MKIYIYFLHLFYYYASMRKPNIPVFESARSSIKFEIRVPEIHLLSLSFALDTVARPLMSTSWKT